MTQYERPSKRPDGRFYGFHHVEFYVSNAKQAADWMVLRFGFKRIAYKGLETNSREYCSHAVKQGRIIFVYTSPLLPNVNDMNKYIQIRGDAVKDIAFWVDNVNTIYNKAIKRGAKSILKPTKCSDKNGTVIKASLETYGNCIHTLIQNVNYKGPFLPEFEAVDINSDALQNSLPKVGLEIIDHCVGNQRDGEMIQVADWYSNVLDFHRFWSVDDTQVHTEYSALRSIVMTDFDRIVKMPLNEPAKAKKKITNTRIC